MITYDYELHTRNIAAMNARNDDTEEQLVIDVLLAAELQRTIDATTAGWKTLLKLPDGGRVTVLVK